MRLIASTVFTRQRMERTGHESLLSLAHSREHCVRLASLSQAQLRAHCIAARWRFNVRQANCSFGTWTKTTTIKASIAAPTAAAVGARCTLQATRLTAFTTAVTALADQRLAAAPNKAATTSSLLLS